MSPVPIDLSSQMKANNAEVAAVETPTSKMAKLEVKSRTKRGKLASSKSLTQLVPRSLFFLRRNGDTNELEQQPEPKQKQKKPKKSAAVPSKLVTCRSFPTNKTGNNNVNNKNNNSSGSINNKSSNINNTSKSNMFTDYSIDESQATSDDDNVDLDFDISPELCDRMHELRAWPRPASKSNPLKSKLFGQSTDGTNKRQQEVCLKKQRESEARENGLPGLGIIFNPQKGRFLFTRGNKFVLPRCKSKQPFTKLTNEQATPSPTKLYSPFGIETPETGKAKKQPTKSKRKLNLDNKHQQQSKRQKTPDLMNSPSNQKESAAAAIASRAAQLKLANDKEFSNFVSPTGKFRETVNYVEQSQRDIEAISKAIMTRSALNNNNLNSN